MTQKRSGAYFTPEGVARALVGWAVRRESDRLLDPSCGDGRFLAAHPFSVGVEQDAASAFVARERAPSALVHEGDFFAWAAETSERFECVAGNPPFIRYQTFTGAARERAQRLCRTIGVSISGLASSWAPFLVAAASLVKPGGRMAFVVPAEIGHAPYAKPVLEYISAHFGQLTIQAIRQKLFPNLSEDCWLLYADRAGESTATLDFLATDQFRPADAGRSAVRVDLEEWRSDWGGRLRPFLLPASSRALYRKASSIPGTVTLGDVASVGIGYVSGANDFFHLRPTVVDRLGIPESVLIPSVRNGRSLPRGSLTTDFVRRWIREDDAIYLLNLPKSGELPTAVRRYLDTDAGREARLAYKCRTRTPWWSVPDVRSPDLFLTYMSGRGPNLVRNAAGCTGTNSVHHVRLRRPGTNPSALVRQFESTFVQLSCEIEGHPLGGGMLKLEPREAASIRLPRDSVGREAEVAESLAIMRSWRLGERVTEHGSA